MRKNWFLVDKWRMQFPGYESQPGDLFGTFLIPYNGAQLRVIATDGDYLVVGLTKDYAWEHVSVSLENRCPTWEEMSFVKNLFWKDDETVIQFHVPKPSHVNFHPFCLHLWRPILKEIPLPPIDTVGPK